MHGSHRQTSPAYAKVKKKTECPSYKTTRVPDKSDVQERRTRVSHKSPTRVFRKSVPQKCLLQECQKLIGRLFSSMCLHSGSGVPSCYFQEVIVEFYLEAYSSMGSNLLVIYMGNMFHP